MEKIRFIAFLVVLCCVDLNAQSIWPEGKKAAIVLSYDDGVNSHLDVAIPQLNQFDLKGTFFLYGYFDETRISEWRQATEQGHELGNHTIYHPCKGNCSKKESPRFCSENYDVPSILREIMMMNKMIYAIQGDYPVSYAYPCGETVVGGVDYVDSLRQSGLLKYARNGREPEGVTDFDKIDFFKVPGFGVTKGASSKELIDYTNTVLKRGGLGVYIFHGVGGDYLDVSAEAHLELLKYLSENDEIWVAPFGEVMKYIENKLDNN